MEKLNNVINTLDQLSNLDAVIEKLFSEGVEYSQSVADLYEVWDAVSACCYEHGIPFNFPRDVWAYFDDDFPGEYARDLLGWDDDEVLYWCEFSNQPQKLSKIDWIYRRQSEMATEQYA